MKRITWRMPITLVLSAFLLGTAIACSSHKEPVQERYVTGQTPVRAVGARINLEEVQRAFWETKGRDFQDWMHNFEERVNNIYDGNEVLSIDASREGRYFKVIGFINKDNDPGFNGAGDEKLFQIDQTGEVTNNRIPYRMSGWDDRPYYTGYHGLTHSAFLDALLVGAAIHTMTRPPHYYTPPQRTVIIRREVADYRHSSDYNRQRQANSDFSRRTTGLNQGTSSRSFANTSTSSGTRKRSWYSGNTSPSTSSWSGRRGGSLSSESAPTSSWSSRRSTSSSSSWSSRRRRR